jgi:hypothetical protein
MENNVFDAMKSLCVKEVDRTLGGRKVAAHTIRHESRGVIGMGRRFPRVESKLIVLKRIIDFSLFLTFLV